jgi:hypothetical protein
VTFKKLEIGQWFYSEEKTGDINRVTVYKKISVDSAQDEDGVCYNMPSKLKIVKE